MRNILRVLTRDVKRLFRHPSALLVALFLIVLPSLYTWFNVVGFWNPYANTGNLRVCVVNEDAGTDDETLGHLDLGAQIVGQLQDDTRLKWEFTDRDGALQQIEGGRAYAAFVIPPHFSADVATLLTADFRQPTIGYYVNEKAGPVAPKIMDTGANSLDTSINSTFISTVSSAIAQELDDRTAATQAAVTAANARAVDRLDRTAFSLAQARKAIGNLKGAAQDATGKAAGARAALSDAKERVTALSDDLKVASDLAAQANSQLVRGSAEMSGALDRASKLVAQTAAKASLAAGKTSAGLTAAKGDVDAAIERGLAATEEGGRAAAALKELHASLPSGTAKETLGQAISALETSNEEAEKALEDLKELDADIAKAAESSASAAEQVSASAQTALDAADGYRDDLSEQAIPAVSEGLSSLVAASSGVSASVAAQSGLVDRASAALDQLQSTLDLVASALAQTDTVIVGLQDGLESVRIDLAALSSANDLGEFLGQTEIDPARVAEFMQSPTTVETAELYPMNAYGSAMAPLFINLTLWIGVFMLLVIMRIEVDEEGVPGITASQRFFGRELLLAGMCVLQATVCCTGCLAIGVQAANVPAFYFTAIVASLSYLSIQFTLSATFQHLGKAMCVILVFVQIPAATGLYPIEMTPEFFRVVYPLFPFTYGINAMRETVFGFYGSLWASELAVLAGFQVAFLAIGALARRYTANINRMFARQAEESDLINIEQVELPERHYRIAQIFEALLDRDEQRAEMEERALKFMKLYPRLRVWGVIGGIGLPTIATLALALTAADKVVMLTAWLLWIVGIIIFFLAVDYIRDRMVHQLSLGELSEEELAGLYARRMGGEAPVGRIRRRRSGAIGDAAAEAQREASPEPPGTQPHTPAATNEGGAR